MQIMIDTNVLISMIFFPGKQMNGLKKIICEQHSIVLCSYVVDELLKVTERKFSSKAKEVDGFLKSLPFHMVYTPKFIDADNFPSVRDEMDTPILATAILEDVDILITGDKDFSDIEIERPEILTPSEFLRQYT